MDEVLKSNVCFYSYCEKRLQGWKSCVSAIFLTRCFLPSGLFGVLGWKSQLWGRAAEGISPCVNPPVTYSASLWPVGHPTSCCLFLCGLFFKWCFDFIFGCNGFCAVQEINWEAPLKRTLLTASPSPRQCFLSLAIRVFLAMATEFPVRIIKPMTRLFGWQSTCAHSTKLPRVTVCIDLSHESIILKHLNILAGFSLRAGFPKEVRPLEWLLGLVDIYSGTSKFVSRYWSLVLHPHCCSFTKC